MAKKKLESKIRAGIVTDLLRQGDSSHGGGGSRPEDSSK